MTEDPPPDNAEKAETTVNVYDQAIRHLLQSDPIGMIRWLVPKLSKSCRFINWHDTRNWPFPGFADLVCDLVANLSNHPQGKPTHALVLEFMARAKSSIFDRALQYAVEAYQRPRHGKDRKGRYQTHVAVINLAGRNPSWGLKSGPPQDPSEAENDEGWSFKPTIRNLCDDDAAAVLDGIEADTIPFGALALVPLMKDGNTPDIISRWRKRLEQVKHEQWRPTLAALTVMFAELRKQQKTWANSLKGWNMLESQVVREWQTLARREGHQKGRLEQAQSALMTVLRARFQDLGGNGLELDIAGQTDLDVLSQWLISAVNSSRLDEFREKIRRRVAPHDSGAPGSA